MKFSLIQIRGYFKTPYPYYYNNAKRVFFVLLGICVLSFSFSFFFDPFDVNVTEHKINSIGILLIHAFIPLPIAYIYISLVNKSLKDEITWTLGKEIFNLSMILFLIGLVDFLIRDLIYINPNNWSIRYFWEEIRNTFLVGFLLLLIVLPLNVERLLKKHTASLRRLSPKPKSPSINSIITIKNSVSNESFDLKIKDFLFAKVESNYTEVFTSSSDVVNKTLIRITLKDLEEQLKPVTHKVFKTHRSYLVNLNAVDSISGNAQGYQLLLKNCSTLIPVSRTNIAGFNTIYSKI